MTEIKTWKAQAMLVTASPSVQPQQKPVLQDIEQYRLQMAGISTAAIGYWKEGDGIHPDYDTLALRDVAELYQKYDVLYKAQSEMQDWEAVAADQAMTIALLRSEAITQAIPQIPQEHSSNRTWVGLTDDEVYKIAFALEGEHWRKVADAIEAKLKEKNHVI